MTSRKVPIYRIQKSDKNHNMRLAISVIIFVISLFFFLHAFTCYIDYEPISYLNRCVIEDEWMGFYTTSAGDYTGRTHIDVLEARAIELYLSKVKTALIISGIIASISLLTAIVSYKRAED